MECKRAQKIISKVKMLSYIARERDIPVIYVNDAHISGVDRELSIWGEHAIKGTHGSTIINELEPQNKDIVIEKHHYSAFFETHLNSVLKGLGVNTVVITGILADVCIRHTCSDAFSYGYNVCVITDAIEAESEDVLNSEISYFKSTYNANTLTTSKLIDTINEE